MGKYLFLLNLGVTVTKERGFYMREKVTAVTIGSLSAEENCRKSTTNVKGKKAAWEFYQLRHHF
jgi:hypothetical protein